MSPSTDQPKPPQSAPSPRFRVVHLLYATALLAAALATFGAGGLIPGLVVLAAWIRVFCSRSRPRALAFVSLVFVALCCVLGLLWPAGSHERELRRRMQCGNNLRGIGLALHNYHDVHGTLPPAYLADADGRPVHSWRVLILPYIEEQTLYQAYRFDEPWDGPNNRLLTAQMPRMYRCPSQPRPGAGSGSTTTNYLAVVGPQTAWPGDEVTSLAHFTGGTSHAVLIIEAESHEVSWMEPADIGHGEALQLLSAADPGRRVGHPDEDFFYKYCGGRHVVLADGSIRLYHDGASAAFCRAWLDVALEPTQESSDEADAYMNQRRPSARRPKYDNWFRLGMFALLVVWPLPRVWRSPR